MLPYAHYMIGHEFLFQHDNAPPHTVLIKWEFIADPTPEFIWEMGDSWQFEVMDWPAQIPDLNPLKNLWDEMGWRIQREDRPRNKSHLFEILKLHLGGNGPPYSFTSSQIFWLPCQEDARIMIDARGAFTRNPDNDRCQGAFTRNWTDPSFFVFYSGSWVLPAWI